MPTLRAVNLNRFEVFSAVVKTGSFTAAAERLGITKAMVSQHVSRLEAELGVALLTRTTRRLSLTEPGRKFAADCGRIIEEAEAAIAGASGSSRAPRGTLRLTTVVDYASAVVAPALAAFVWRHPQVHVDLVATDQVLDLVAGGFDLAIRMSRPSDSTLHAVKIGEIERLLVASPAYLERHGAPHRLADLAKHNWIAHPSPRAGRRQTFTDSRGHVRTLSVRSTIQGDTMPVVKAFVLAGAGVAALPEIHIEAELREGRLVRLLPRYRCHQQEVHAVFPSARYMPAKVRAFLDLLRNA
jgi:DNA-binding transcriptional LysR family regulator